MPVYKGRALGTWRVIVPDHGRQHEEIVRGLRSEAMAHEAALRLRMPSEQETRAGLTVRQWCLGPYLDGIRPRVRASTCKLRLGSLSALMPTIGDLKLSAVSTAALDRAIAARCSKVMLSTTRRDLQALRHALRMAAEAGHHVGRYVLRLPPREHQRATAYSDEELARLFAEADAEDRELGALVRWLLLMGLRRGEAMAARWSWVHGDVLSIPDRDTLTGWRPKGKRGRDVPLSTEARRLMPHTMDKVWRWKRWPQELAEPAWQAAGLDGCSHRLRHTFASKFLAVVPDLWLLGRIMGHSSTQTTELYLHMLPGRLERATGVVRLPKLMARRLAQK